MIPVEFGFDEATTIVLPGPELAAHEVTDWAAASASRIAAHQFLASDQHAVLAKALARAQQSAARDGATHLLVFEPATRTFAPVRFAVLGDEMSETDQQAFLWPPATLRPQVRKASAHGLGDGCSCTVREEDGHGSVRWLFVPTGATFFAGLGPIPAGAIGFAAALVEEILDTVRLDGQVRETAPGFDPARLVAVQANEGWRV